MWHELDILGAPKLQLRSQSWSLSTIYNIISYYIKYYDLKVLSNTYLGKQHGTSFSSGSVAKELGIEAGEAIVCVLSLLCVFIRKMVTLKPETRS